MGLENQAATAAGLCGLMSAMRLLAVRMLVSTTVPEVL